MTFNAYRNFLKTVIEIAMRNEYVKDWFDVNEINVNGGYIMLLMENFNNRIKIEIPHIDRCIPSDDLAVEWAKDLQNQLLDVIEHYQKATLELHNKHPGELTQ